MKPKNLALQFIFYSLLFVASSANAQMGIGTNTPHSTLDVRGSVATNYRAFTTGTTASSTDNVLVFTGTGATTITLPTAVGCAGRYYVIKNASTTGPTPALTIATTAAQTIDGAASWLLDDANETVTVISNGANWNISSQISAAAASTEWSQNGNSLSAVKTLGTTSNHDLPVITNNTEKLRVTSTGNVGIGTTTPSQKLDVNGNMRLSGAFMPNNTAGTSGQILTSAGTGAAPTWTDLSSTIGNYAWLQGGNSLSSAQTLGTTSNHDLPIITNNTEKMRVTNSGNVGIGTSTFNGTNPEKLVVDAGTTTSVNAIVGKGSIDSYLQLNIQNNSAGANASSDVVATANNGSETTNFVDMGINGGSNTSGVMGAANDAYLYNIGQNMLIGTGTANKSLLFMTGGTSQASNERMRIDGTGNVGIGTTSPAYKLSVNATNPLFLNGVQTGANTDSVMTIINGLVKKIHPSALTTSSSNAWALVGNNNTLASNYFLGTTNTDPLIIKTNSTQVGRFNQNSLALGLGATTNNATQSYALGGSASISNGRNNSFAIGNSAATTDNNSFSIGNSASVTGTNSFAVGNSATTNGNNSVAIGSAATTAFSISDALAVGTGATVNSSSAIVIGKNATTGFSLSPTIAIGNNASSDANSGVAIGNAASLGFNNNGVAIGTAASASTTANNSVALGNNAAVTVANTVLLGEKNNSNVSVAIGSESFSSNREKLLVDAGTTSSFNVISGKGSIDNYLQLNIQNNSAGNSASSDVVATSNNGNETTNYIDMGINSSTYNAASFNVTGANDAYLYSTGNDLAIGNATTSKALKFFTGGTLSSNERMRIDGNGNVGIGTTTIPKAGVGAAKFAINGTNASMSGPHMQFTTSADNHPQLQILPWMHDNSFIMFDSYWDGSNWKSATSTGGNFMLTKTSGLLQMNYANVNTQGGTIAGFNYGLVLNPTGNVGVGSASFDGTNPEKLLVDAGTTSSYNVISGKGTIDNYLQLNIQNRSNTANASSDVVATAANGNETVNFIDMGINSGAYSNASSPILNGANNAYIYSTGNDFVIGNGTAGKNIIFFNGGYATTNEKLRIHSSGNVGVATAAPTSSFQVTGSVAMSTVTKTANYTATANDYSILCNNTSGAITISLPAAAGCAGRIYIIKKISGALNNVVIDANGAETIDGAATRTLLNQYESVQIQSDGNNWFVL